VQRHPYNRNLVKSEVHIACNCKNIKNYEDQEEEEEKDEEAMATMALEAAAVASLAPPQLPAPLPPPAAVVIAVEHFSCGENLFPKWRLCKH
jgi:hypothetical protein